MGGDGQYPYAGLVQWSDGNFYGTTEQGGASSKGTVFKITPSGPALLCASRSEGGPPCGLEDCICYRCDVLCGQLWLRPSTSDHKGVSTCGGL